MRFLFTLLWVAFGCFSTAFAQPKLTLADIWKSSKFNGDYIYGLRSMQDGNHYTSLDADRGGQVINKYDYETGQLVEPILQSISLTIEGNNDPVNFDEYDFSSDEKKILIATNTESVYRHSTVADYFVYDLEAKTFEKLFNNKKQRIAVFSPLGNQVAFMQDNNLFVKDLATKKVTQITHDGEWNKIINGGTDWVYEEEFGFNQAFFWSPNGQNIAFYKFDESLVKEFTMAMYGNLYPNNYSFKYPKAGEDNAKVSLHIYNLQTNKSIEAKLGEYEYIPRIKWANNSQLAVLTLNRLQNNLDFYLVNATNGNASLVFNEKSDTYIEITDNWTFLPENNGFLWTSEKSGFNHIYHYTNDGKTIKQLTSGNWDISEIIGYDSKRKLVFYTSYEDTPLEKQTYSLKITGKSKKKLTAETGNHHTSFSKTFNYFIDYYNTANQPTTIVLKNADGTVVRTLVDNKELNKKLAEYNFPKKEFFEINLENNLTLNAWMIKPANFNPEKKYPVLMYVYGGPGSQTVKNSWDGKNLLWYYLLTQKNYIIISVDNRGTGARGRDFRTITYKQLGNIETQDQIDAAKKIAQFNFVDASRIGIWGWSYGGYMSSLCLAKGNEVFKTAIAVAPVTNWRFYDNIYTERYMQTPQENGNGYDDNSPINHVDKITGKLLLVHGSADDNVHYQNTMEMIDALVKANVNFDLMIYPNKNHGIYGGNTRLHLYQKMTDFILQNL